MDAVADSTTTLLTMEVLQQPAALTCHPPRRNMGKWEAERPTTMEDQTLFHAIMKNQQIHESSKNCLHGQQRFSSMHSTLLPITNNGGGAHDDV